MNQKIKEQLGEFISVDASYLKTKYYNTPRNQYLIRFANGVVFKSYDTIIGVKLFTNQSIKLYLDPKHDNYTATTNYYTNQFTNMGVAERRKAVERGYNNLFTEIKVMSLN